MSLTLRNLRKVGTALVLAAASSHASAGVALRVESRPIVGPIDAYVLATDDGGSIEGLGKPDFSVTLDGAPLAGFEVFLPPRQDPSQKVSVVVVARTSPLSTVSSYDVLIDQLEVGDYLSVVRYWGDIEMPRHGGLEILPFTQVDAGAGSDALTEFMHRPTPLGGSPRFHFDGVMAALRAFEHPLVSLPDGPKAIITLNTGGGWQSLSDVIAAANAESISIFNVGYPSLDQYPDYVAHWTSLAMSTGGVQIPALAGTESEDLLASMISWLENGYRIAIPHDAVTDCDPHRLEVTVQGETNSIAFVRCDTTPDRFSFARLLDVAVSTVVVSETATITGIETAVPVSVIDGEYSIGCGSNFTSEPGWINPDDSVCLRHTTAAEAGFESSTLLIVGDESAWFSSSTLFPAPPPPPPPPPPDVTGNNAGGGGPMGITEALLLLALLLVRCFARKESQPAPFTTLALATSLVAPLAQAAVEMRIDARPLGEPIQIHALIEDTGGPVAGLSAADVTVTLDGNPVTDFALTRPRSLGADVKTSVAIVTGFNFVQDVDSTDYKALIRQLNAGDQAAVVKFRVRPNGESTYLYMSTLPFVEIDGGANSAEAIRFLSISPEYYDSWSWGQPGPSPAIHALEVFAARQSSLPAGPKVLIGAFASGESRLGDLIDRAIEDDIALFNVAYSGESLGNFLAKRAATRETGGALVVVDDESQDDIAISRIGDWLNDSYRLSIPAAAVVDCGLHTLELAVRGESMVQSFVRCDSRPDPFYFDLADEVEPDVAVISKPVTITGIDSPVPVEVFGGEYSIGCGTSFTSEPGYLQPQDVVCVRHQTSDLPNDLRQTVLSVGSSWAAFESLTRYFQRPPPPTPRPDNGGGGSTGLLEVLLLLIALFTRLFHSARTSARLLAMSAVLGMPAALAETGDLDPTFADHGRQVDIAGSAVRSVELTDAGGVFVGSSGVVIAGPFYSCDKTVVSYASQFRDDGLSEPSFHSVRIDGIQALAFARLADGGIVGVGRRVIFHGFGGRCYTYIRSLAAFRLQPDGSLDTGFGADGIFDWEAGELSSLHQGHSLLVEANGAIVIAGIMVTGDTGESRLLVLRLLSDGSLDPSFGDGGLHVGSDVMFDKEVRIARAKSGSYRVAGMDPDGCMVAGITTDGQPDFAFGIAGVARVVAQQRSRVTCTDLQAKASGRLIVAGSARKHGFVTQLLANGAVDPAFAAGAEIANSLSAVTAITPGRNGSVMVAGVGPKGTSILRLDAAGALDTSFGDGGRTWIDLPSDYLSKPTVNDMVFQADGSLIAAGTGPFVARLLGDAGGESAGVVSILPADASAREADGRAVIRVRRSGGGDGNVSVGYRTVADGNATAGEDFTMRAGTLHWADGDRSMRAINVDISGSGGSVELEEDFHVALENFQGGAGLGRAEARVSIKPDGEPGGQIQFNPVADGTIHPIVREDGDFVQVWLGRDYYDAGRVCVTVATRSGTATAGEDFTATESRQCWEDRDTEFRVVEIPILRDNLGEQDERFTVVLSHPTGGAIVGARRVARITISANTGP